MLNEQYQVRKISNGWLVTIGLETKYYASFDEVATYINAKQNPK